MKKPVFGIMLAFLLMTVVILSFHIQPVKAQGTVYIKSDGSIDPPSAPISTMDNVTYTLTGDITSPGYYGLAVQRDNIMVDGAGFTFLGNGVYLAGRRNVMLKNANFESGGIFLFYSSGCVISGNSVNGSSAQGGIQIEGGWWDPKGGNIFSGNNITHCAAGIFYNSSGNVFEGNYIAYNGYGILNYDVSWNNSFTENTVAYNNYGISLLDVRQVMYHNNFLNNTGQVSYSNVTFDNGSEGNFWSSYKGADSDGDGIGDTPFIVFSGIQDNYPLMSPYLYADVNHDAVVDMRDIGLLCDAFASYPGHQRWNPHCDINGDSVVNMRDIGIACNNFMKRWE